MKVNQDAVNDAVNRIMQFASDVFAGYTGHTFNLLEVNDIIAVLATRLATSYLEHVKGSDQALEAFQRLVGMCAIYRMQYAPLEDSQVTQLLM